MMSMKKYVIISILLGAFQVQVLAQNPYDALLFSRHYAGSTARSIAMGGAFGALGGDVSVLSTNPAGLGVFRSSEFTFSPTVNISGTQANFESITFSRRNDTRFIFNNLGYVYNRNFNREKGLQTFNFGIAYNRLSDFNHSARVSTPSASSSLLDEFVMYANDGDWGEHYEGLAWETYAIDFDDDEEIYFNDFMFEGYRYGELSRRTNFRGGIGEYAFSVAFNFNHNLYVGATLGIQDIQYGEAYNHVEITPNDFEFLNSFTFREEYNVTGTGVNFKAGVLYRPIPLLRFGAAIHTPTYIWMQPDLYTVMYTFWNKSPAPEGGTSFMDDARTDFSERYRLSTPWRYMMSAAAVIGTLGAVSTEIELVDFSQNIILPEDDYLTDNSDISKDFKAAVNIKSGLEFRLGPVSFRGGFAFYGSPYHNNFSGEINDMLKGTMSYSGGIGFRRRGFSIDGAYSFTKHPDRAHFLYDYLYSHSYKLLQVNAHKAILTLGFRF